MNARVAKLLNRWSALKQLNPRDAKRAWHRTPRQHRQEQRRETEREVEESK